MCLWIQKLSKSPQQEVTVLYWVVSFLDQQISRKQNTSQCKMVQILLVFGYEFWSLWSLSHLLVEAALEKNSFFRSQFKIWNKNVLLIERTFLFQRIGVFYRYKNSDSGGLQYLFLNLFCFMKQLQQDLDQHSSGKQNGQSFGFTLSFKCFIKSRTLRPDVQGRHNCTKIMTPHYKSRDLCLIAL